MKSETITFPNCSGYEPPVYVAILGSPKIENGGAQLVHRADLTSAPPMADGESISVTFSTVSLG